MNSAIPPGNFEMLSRLKELDLCGLFLKLNNSLGQVVIQSKKSQGVWHYLCVFRVLYFQSMLLKRSLNMRQIYLFLIYSVLTSYYINIFFFKYHREHTRQTLTPLVKLISQ